MKIKTLCPHCQMWQMFKDTELGTDRKSVRCKMNWCQQIFDSSKTPKNTAPHPDHEVLKRA